MIQQHYSEVVSAELLKGNIDNNEFDGFLQDYRVLHCLLKTYNPKSVFEIGTNMGTGTNIICNALPDAQVYSLDLPTELAHKSLQHPISEGKGDLVGSRCTFPYKQFRVFRTRYIIGGMITNYTWLLEPGLPMQ
jgi:spermidine synthase